MKKKLLGLLFILSVNYGYANYEVEVSNIYNNDFSTFVDFAPNDGGYIKTIVNKGYDGKSIYQVKEDYYYPDEINTPYYSIKYQYLQGLYGSDFSILDDKGEKFYYVSKKGYTEFSNNGKSYAVMLSMDGDKWFLFHDGKTTSTYDYIEYYYINNLLIYKAKNKKLGNEILGVDGNEYDCHSGCKSLSTSKDGKHFSFYIEKNGKKVLYKDGQEYGSYDEIGEIGYFDNGKLIFSAKKDGQWFLDKEGIKSKKYDDKFIDLFMLDKTVFNYYNGYDKNLFFSTMDKNKNNILVSIGENSNDFLEYNIKYTDFNECYSKVVNKFIYCSGIKDIGTSNYTRAYFRYDINKNTFEDYFILGHNDYEGMYYTDNKSIFVYYENGLNYIYENKNKINYGFDVIKDFSKSGDNYCFNTMNGKLKYEPYYKNAGKYSIVFNGNKIYENDGVYDCRFSKSGNLYYYTFKSNKYFLVFSGKNYPLYDNKNLINFYSDNNGNFDFYTYKNGNLVINNSGNEYELKNYELLFQTDYVFFLKNKSNNKQVMFVNGNFSNEYDALDYSDIFHKYVIATINGKKLVVSDDFVESQVYDNFGGYLGQLEDGSLVLLGENGGKKTLIINGKEDFKYQNIINMSDGYNNIKIIAYEKNGKFYSTLLDEKELMEKYGLKNINETPKAIQPNLQLDKTLNKVFEKVDEKGDENAQKIYKTLISKIDILLKNKLSEKNKNTLNYIKEKVEAKIK